MQIKAQIGQMHAQGHTLERVMYGSRIEVDVVLENPYSISKRRGS